MAALHLFATKGANSVGHALLRCHKPCFRLLWPMPANVKRMGPMERLYHHINVFTDRADGGNPLAVIIETDDLDGESMQMIARKIGLSETVFVFKPENPAHLAAIRIFTPGSELPFAGHPTIGTAVFLARERLWRPREAEFEALAVLEAKGGILRVGVMPAGENTAFAEFDTPKTPQEIAQPAPVDRIAAALGLAPSDIGFENFRPRCFSAGVPYTYVPIHGLEAIGRAQIVDEYWSEAFSKDQGEPYLYCRETVMRRASFHARLFAPNHGIEEDPATGSAAAGFVGVVQLFDNPPDGLYKGIIEQGIEMGMPSQIYLEAEIRQRTVCTVRIGGHAVYMGEKTVAE